METDFAPAKRQELSIIRESVNFIYSRKMLTSVLDKIQEIVLVLNQERQAIFANRNLMNLLGIDSFEKIMGGRPGEILQCVHAHSHPGGCGTSGACKYCGAVNAVLECMAGQQKVIKEARIRLENGASMDLEVAASPLEIADKQYTILSVMDIGDKKRKRTLERIFFHDIMNIAGSLCGFAGVIRENHHDKHSQFVFELTHNLIEEIQSQRQLLAAENSELQIDIQEIETFELLDKIANFFNKSSLTRHRKILIDQLSDNERIHTDRTILRRILINLVKNAIEASRNEAIIEMGCYKESNIIKFTVVNPEYISRDIQMQIFQRSFTTKGKGRGMGTYSVKLLTEQYLKGTVGFVSDENKGTEFTISLPVAIREM
ncbi:MAG: ATP-binding protein [Vulcanimicrobiota bacterium]